MIEDLPLDQYNKRIPTFSFEIQKILDDQVNHKIKSVVMIPGSGEFVYDTSIQTKTSAIEIQDHMYPIEKSKNINQNTNYNQADALVAIEQMQSSLPEPNVGICGN